jgi:hypothetical protein
MDDWVRILNLLQFAEKITLAGRIWREKLPNRGRISLFDVRITYLNNAERGTENR